MHVDEVSKANDNNAAHSATLSYSLSDFVAIAIAAGSVYTCAKGTGGEFKCWGQLDIRGTTSGDLPADVAGAAGEKAGIVHLHACA
jgi:hypothetical protein